MSDSKKTFSSHPGHTKKTVFEIFQKTFFNYFVVFHQKHIKILHIWQVLINIFLIFEGMPHFNPNLMMGKGKGGPKGMPPQMMPGMMPPGLLIYNFFNFPCANVLKNLQT